MSVESDAAAQVASIYTKGIEEAAHVGVKIGGEVFEVSKDLAIFLVRWLALEEFKRSGEVRVHNLLRKAEQKGYPVAVLELKSEEDYNKAAEALENIGVVFAKGKKEYSILFTEDAASQVDRTIKNLGINTVETIKSDVTASKDNEKLEIVDSDLKQADTVDEYEQQTTKPVKLEKDEQKESTIKSNDLNEVKTYDSYLNDVPLDIGESKEYDDPDQFVKDFMHEREVAVKDPLSTGGESPSVKRSENGKDKVSSVKEKIEANKEKLAQQAAAVKDGAKELSSAVKDMGGK